ncbi:MAG TPA: HisA/HisF-related TIM barrel protein [Alphaproteobacteria bacterium]|jgi:cyclase
MLKVRIIPVLLYRNHSLVKTVRFDAPRRVGTPQQAINVYNLREVDELVLLDIDATAQGRTPDLALIDELADGCFMPFAVGGGIRSARDVAELLRVGADKVVVNSGFAERPELVREIADDFGTQAVVVSIDARRVDGRHRAFARNGRHPTGCTPSDLARRAEDQGAGEILLTSIDRDGTMEGYDLDLVAEVARRVTIPVIACGGCGILGHMAEAVAAGASAAAAASMFHFTEQTPREAKLHLKDAGYAVRT